MTNIDQLTDKFLLLGGKIKNAIIKIGRYGRGAFREDSTQNSRIFTPKKLLLPTRNVIVSNKAACILGQSGNSHEHAFFTDYINSVINEKEYAEETIRDEYNPSNLPEEISYCGKIFPKDDKDIHDLILQKLITTRAINYQDSEVFAPFWDLVNHSPQAYRFESNQRGVTTPSITTISEDDEILHRYNLIASPLGRALTNKFTCKEPFCFSFPFQIKIPKTVYFIKCLGNVPGDILKEHKSKSK